MKRWHVVHTKAGREWAAYKHLMFQGFRPLYLHYKVDRRIGNGRIIHDVPRPYMPRYLYAYTESSNVFTINNSFGVSTVLRNAGGPLVLPDAEVELQIQRAGAGINGVVPPPDPEKRKRIEAGVQVRIVAGPFAGFFALIQIDLGDRIKALVSIFGRDTPAEFKPDEIQAM